MKISFNWIKDYIDFEWSPLQLADKLTMAGLEVEEVKEIIPESDKIVIGKIVEIKKHPNASKLTICTTDVGNRTLSIVCGAPNVKEGQSVITALNGAVLPMGDCVEEAKIRGILSEGMICSEKELGISDDHSGIIILRGSFHTGEMFKFGPEQKDTFIDIDITPNRPDCMNMVGIAREIAALNGNKMKIPEINLTEIDEKIENAVNIEILDKINCPRYTARIIRDIKIAPSPVWLKMRLRSVGVRAINNIVDITNYVLMELGQPLHSFDNSLIQNNKIVVRLAKKNEKFITLDEVERELDTDSLLICDGKRPVALAGIMGGRNSEVSENTKDVLLESAFFNPVNIGKTSRKFNLSTEASVRFSKRVDPQNVDFASHRAITMMKDIAGGKIVKGCLDVNYLKEEKKSIIVRPEKVSDILGKKITGEQIISILEGLEFEIEKKEDIVVTVPSFRESDITREIDLIEEIARIYGYDNIEEASYLTIPIQGQMEENNGKYLDIFRDIFTGMGFYEIITNSMTGERQKEWIENNKGVIELRNPISDELSLMRKTLVENILRTMEYNKNREQKNVRIFEIGNVFSGEEGKDPSEFESLRIAGAIEGTIESPNWKNNKTLIDFYYVKGILETFFNKIMLDNYDFIYYDKSRLTDYCAINIEGEFSGFFGRVEDNYLDIPGKNDIFVFELSINNIINKISSQEVKFSPIPQFPSIERDLVVLVSKDVSAGEIINEIKKYGGSYLKKVNVFDLYKGKQIPDDKKSIGFALQFYSFEKTLTEVEIDNIIKNILDKLYNTIGARLREK